MRGTDERFFQKQTVRPMIKKLLLPVVLALYAIVSYAQTDTSRYRIYFNSGRYQLTATHQNELGMFFDTLLPFPPAAVLITGSADEDGGTSFNYQLGLKRAQTLQSFIERSGISPAIIQTISLGEGSPAAGYDKRLNRYAEVTFIIPRPADTIAKAEQPEESGNLDDLYAQLRPRPQEFCIDITRDTFLTGNKGTIINYKANTIKATDINCRCFKLLLNEYFDNSDLVLNNLTTTSDGQLLESGGMVRLQGFCDDKPYELKAGQYLTVMVPADTILPGMKLLSANRDSDADYLNWTLDPDYPELDDFDYDRMMWQCGYRGNPVEMSKCPFFFCRIGDFFRGIFSERKYKSKDVKNNEASSKEALFINKYALKGEDLAVALRKSRDKAGKDALKYYVYKNANWDYRNIDRYKPGSKFIDFIVNNKPSAESDVKLMYRSTRTAVPCFERANSYVFKSISEDAAVWAIGIRYTSKQQIFLAIKEVNTSDKRTTLDFGEVSVEELKRRLKVLDKR
jgi:hypothetical protein